MPITKSNFEQFYAGAGAEFKIISDLFLHGFEAYKPSPDIGFDILVTNKALSKFKGEVEFHKYLQVKSTFMVNNEVSFFLTDDEINCLICDDNVSTVFCYFKPCFDPDPQSFERGDFEPWMEDLEASYQENLYKNHFREIKREGCLTQLDFKQLQVEYFWLNNNQLRRAVNNGVFERLPDKDLYKMTVRAEDGFLYTSERGEYETMLVNEITKIYYMFNTCRGEQRLLDGDFLQAHY